MPLVAGADAFRGVYGGCLALSTSVDKARLSWSIHALWEKLLHMTNRIDHDQPPNDPTHGLLSADAEVLFPGQEIQLQRRGQHRNTRLPEGGFYRRWLAYASNRHGGKSTPSGTRPANYTVSILKVASSQMTATEITARESSWKTRLGSRAHG